jgi:hypothetical protein
MGGGMGGMGGGMGGMGGGMGGMGGGMFNLLPQQLLNNNNLNNRNGVQGLQAFFVNPEPVDGAAAAKAAPKATMPSMPDRIEMQMVEGENPVTAWDKYFSANTPAPAAVRDATRQLMHEKKFDHVAAMLEAALRHRQWQPWMYEALTLAMQAAGKPRAEIERAVMSARDFVVNTADLMYLGAYLETLQLYPRAMEIFHQVSELEPLWSEPYMHGLKVAQKINDLEGIRWAACGILSQAWPAKQAEIWKSAQRVAQYTVEQLRKSHQGRAADQFQAAIDAAMARDCAVSVSWTGNADVDLMVEEPSGTVCSLRNWRTTAGGTMCGDVVTPEAAAAGQGHTAIYLCPKGFSGNYKLLVRRVWGEVVTGKVTVEVITHYHTAQATRLCKKIPLDKGQAMVAFNLMGGRRTEKLREQQLANAAAGQMAVNQMQAVANQVLAQQIAVLADPRAEAELAAERNAQAGNYGPGMVAIGADGQPLVPFHGAVGYQPVIIVLPEGANLAATAVVSADRRYVRITCVPLFSSISEVHTFNTASGATATTPNIGTGGVGYSGAQGANGALNQQNGNGTGVN